MLLGKADRRGRPSPAVRPDLRPLRPSGSCRSPPPPAAARSARPPQPLPAPQPLPGGGGERTANTVSSVVFPEYCSPTSVSSISSFQNSERSHSSTRATSASIPASAPDLRQAPSPSGTASLLGMAARGEAGGSRRDGRGRGRRRTRRRGHGALGAGSRDGGAAALLPLPLAADVGGVWPGPGGLRGEEAVAAAGLAAGEASAAWCDGSHPRRGRAVPRDGGGAGVAPGEGEGAGAVGCGGDRRWLQRRGVLWGLVGCRRLRVICQGPSEGTV